MSWLQLSDIAAMVSGSLIGADAEADPKINAVSIDTRQVQSSDLFVAIKGERFDAHDFVKDLEDKVAAVLVSREIDCEIPQVLVKDTKLALAKLAKAWRQRFTKPLIGLTGSNGKTTLKEMVSAILSEKGNVLATLGNFNNDIGMPLTLLRLRDEHDYAVIEMGANHFGEIDFLTNVAKPDIAVINNAGAAHLEGFGDIEGVARAKGEIFNSLSHKGVAAINADDEYAAYWLALNHQADPRRKIITFGLNNPADIQGDYLGNGRLLVARQGLEIEQEEIQLKLPGKHNALNALAATAVVSALDIDLQMVKKGLESLDAVPGRLAMVTGLKGSLILDDTYNANPGSMNAAIDVLAEAPGERIMVLGDMGELGSDIVSLHGEVGVSAKNSGIERMFCLGRYSAQACEKFGSPENVYSELDELVKTLKNEVKENVTILVKGSRSAQMERVVDALRSNRSNERC